MIHAARKRRQKARELGTDYIPVEEQRDEKGKSRLVREEDHDRSDDDDSQERIDMTVNTEARDKEKRREAFLASQLRDKCWFALEKYSRSNRIQTNVSKV